MNTPSKIVIIGTSGAGKTTLAYHLGQILGLPTTDLDDLYWEENWTPCADTLFLQRIKNLISQEKWVISGNQYSRGGSLIWKNADLIIWLDFPLHILLFRVLKRTIKRLFFPEKCCGGNYESLSLLFSRNSIILWVFKSHFIRRKRYRQALRTLKLCDKLVLIKTNKDLKKMLQSFVSLSVQ